MQSHLMKVDKLGGAECTVSRCGYTGEDGFEVSVPAEKAEDFCNFLTEQKESNGDQIVKYAGLGARDSLRLEAGLCLYGHELNEDISPPMAMLTWTISKRRKAEGGFLGFDTVKAHMKKGVVKQKRCGFIVEKGAPARQGAEVLDLEGNVIGQVTSGIPSPILKKPIGMAYVDQPFHKSGTDLKVRVRGKEYPIKTSKMPFVPANYYKI